MKDHVCSKERYYQNNEINLHYHLPISSVEIGRVIFEKNIKGERFTDGGRSVKLTWALSFTLGEPANN